MKWASKIIIARVYPRGGPGGIRIWKVKGYLSQILNQAPKGDQSWHGPGFFDP